MTLSLYNTNFQNKFGHIAVLAVNPTADPEVACLIPAQSHTFVETDYEIICMVTLLLPLQEGLLSFKSKSMWMKSWLTA